jgi:translation initiation factor eIF-2B subunit epsilon
VKERFAETNAVIELNGLKIAEDRTFADCARYIFTAMLQVRPGGYLRYCLLVH